MSRWGLRNPVVRAAMRGGASLPPYDADLRVWVDPESLDGVGNSTLVDTDPVGSKVINKGSLGGSFTSDGTTPPTFVAAGGPGSRPCLRFVNGGLLSTLPASTFTFMHDLSEWTSYVVWRTETTAKQNILYAIVQTAAALGSGNSRGTSIFYDDRTAVPRDDRAMFFVSRGSNPIPVQAQSTDDAISAGVWAVMSNRLRNAAWGAEIFINDAFVGGWNPGTPSTLEPTMTLKLGQALGNFPLVGRIADVLIYAGYHDATERAAVHDWLTAKTPGGFPQ